MDSKRMQRQEPVVTLSRNCHKAIFRSKFVIPVIPLNLLGCETGWHGGLLPKIPGSPRFRGSDLRSLSGILGLETSRRQKLENEFPWTHPTFACCRFYNAFEPEACRIRLLIHLVGLPTISLSFVRSFNAKLPVHTDTFKECKVVSHRAQFASRILYSMLDPNRSRTPTTWFTMTGSACFSVKPQTSHHTSTRTQLQKFLQHGSYDARARMTTKALLACFASLEPWTDSVRICNGPSTSRIGERALSCIRQ